MQIKHRTTELHYMRSGIFANHLLVGSKGRWNSAQLNCTSFYITATCLTERRPNAKNNHLCALSMFAHPTFFILHMCISSRTTPSNATLKYVSISARYSFIVFARAPPHYMAHISLPFYDYICFAFPEPNKKCKAASSRLFVLCFMRFSIMFAQPAPRP